MIDDAAIRQLVTDLARPRASGGHAIERAALLAAGSDFGAIEAWILRHGGEPEVAAVTASAAGGLHGLGADATARRAPDGRPVRYQLPVGTLS
jgi:hypothetical protein